ncbi:hypothetical protein IE81DRAFT_118616 [Ceraceosorus guamensis]|uniref:Protein kinase domain-containing protein n=1 Tax=Ceraceosorus guamensis TaxID=1522189 RepID=A0A316VYF2_9BASI|nr:hypothetical protein IE81DRAFT_118616 [Ceraceosorus guamensis]PWN42687.1 hypothetical protein IE81DRAFT_118616 [Ceraceosorus guamensis]
MVFGQFKNLIRHGKAAKEEATASSPQGSTNHSNGSKMRQVPDSHYQALDTLEPMAGQSTVSPTPATAKGTMAAPVTATAQQGGQKSTQHPQNGGAQAHLDEARARVAGSVHSHSQRANSYQEDNVAQYNPQSEKIVQEERAASEKLPSYEGLSDRFTLIKKMGDGAFSNVYMARDQKTGQKVAIKVVRKYELNSNQDRLDPQFRKKNRVTEVRSQCFPFPRSGGRACKGMLSATGRRLLARETSCGSSLDDLYESSPRRAWHCSASE